MIKHAILRDVGIEDNGAKVTNRSFFVTGIESDLSAEVTRMDHPGVILRAAKITGILESDPRVTSFEDHLEHLFPELDGFNFPRPDLPFFGLLFVFKVALLESLAIEVVEIRTLIRAEKSPRLTRFHALHEKIRNPVGGVHVMGPTALVPRVDAKLKEVLNIVVPRLQVGTTGAATLASLVHCDELVVMQLEERNDAL
jgi:hypothetical protein